METLQISLAQHQDKEEWDRYVSTHQQGLPYQYFAWKQAVESAYGFSCPYFIAKQGRRIRGILPTVWVHTPLRKGKLVSLPYCDAGGILADTPEIEKELFEYTCNYMNQQKIPAIEIRRTDTPIKAVKTPHINNADNHSQSQPTASLTEKVRMLLELPDNADALLASFKSKLRSQIKKPIRDGLTASLGGKEMVDCFYPVFEENMRDLGSPVHSIQWILSILASYADKAKCGVVFLPDDTPAAAGIILCHTNMVSIPWASSLHKYNRLNANMLLYWSFLSFAANNGYAFFDFGRSTPGEGTYKFKSQWGAKPHPLYWQQWQIPPKDDFYQPRQTASNSSGRGRVFAERIIQKLPVKVATFWGGRLRKYISL